MSHVIGIKKKHVYTENKLAFDDMATHGVRASAAMVLTFFPEYSSFGTKIFNSKFLLSVCTHVRFWYLRT